MTVIKIEEQFLEEGEKLNNPSSLFKQLTRMCYFASRLPYGSSATYSNAVLMEKQSRENIQAARTYLNTIGNLGDRCIALFEERRLIALIGNDAQKDAFRDEMDNIRSWIEEQHEHYRVSAEKELDDIKSKYPKLKDDYPPIAFKKQLLKLLTDVDKYCKDNGSEFGQSTINPSPDQH